MFAQKNTSNRVSLYLLVGVLLMFATACGPTAPTVSVDEAVALTVAASNAPAELTVDEAVALTVAASNAPAELTVDEIVALTVAAGNVAPTLTVDEIVALTVSAAEQAAPDNSQTTSADATPIVDIPKADSGLQPIQATGDVDANSGTPQLRINVSSANVRNGPGTVYKPISVLLKDSVVPVIAKTANDNWYIIRLPNGELGWVANSVTDPVVAADMAKVQVAATIPPAPTNTPTNTPTATATATHTPAATATSGGATHTPTATTTGATATATSAATATVTPTPAITLISPTAEPSTIVINNRSSLDVCWVLTSPAGGVWTEHLNGSRLPVGASMVVVYPDAGPYDVSVQSCDESASWDEYDNFGSMTLELTD